MKENRFETFSIIWRECTFTEDSYEDASYEVNSIQWKYNNIVSHQEYFPF